jgi:hypothetical protein
MTNGLVSKVSPAPALAKTRMVQLVESDIKTREVLDWKGVHVLR